MKVEFKLPFRTVDPGNARLHWAAKAREAKVQRQAAWLAVLSCRPLPHFPVRVTLTRVGRKVDQQNLGGHFKALIDGIADAYKVDDGDERWQWVFRQERGKHPCVRVEIEALPDR